MARPRALYAFILLALAAEFAPVLAGDPGPPSDGPGRADVVAKTTSLRPGADATLGVRLVLPEHWHAYWKNPGDSGIPPSVEWTLPKGFEAGPMRWPAPRRLDAGGGLVAFGYEGEALFPVALKVPADAKRGEVAIAAHVQWLACDASGCVPGDAHVELRIPVKDAAPADDPAHAAQFAAATARLPRALPAGAARIESTKDRVTLIVAAPELVDDDVRSVDLFCAEQLVLDDASAASFETTKKTQLRVRLAPAPRREDLVKRLQGVLTVTTAKRALAFEIDASSGAQTADPAVPGEKSSK